MKYEYWHRILKINPEREDLIAQVVPGKLVKFNENRSGRVETFNFTTGQVSWLFDVEYVGRIPASMPLPEKVTWLSEHEITIAKKDSSEEGH